MNDEIKEIDNSDLMELLETTFKKDFYRLTLDHELVVRLYNWITNLQEENQRLKELCDKYEEEHNNEFKIWKDERHQLLDYKSRCEKAMEYINKNKHLNWYVESIFTDELINIINGGDVE